MLESFEPSFQQDLNGDGSIGLLLTTVIESIRIDQPGEMGATIFFIRMAGRRLS